MGVEWEGLHLKQLQQSSQSLKAVDAVDKDQGTARIEQQEVVDVYVLYRGQGRGERERERERAGGGKELRCVRVSVCSHSKTNMT